jgi:F420-0:gamma-glutamyl ligase
LEFRKARFGSNLKPMNEVFSVLPIRCEVFRPGASLVPYIVNSVPREKVVERIVVAITSKILSIEEGAIVHRQHPEGTPEQRAEKRKLIEQESERYLGETLYGVSLTVKHGLLIPSAGIDESNSEDGSYILFPKDPYASAKRIHEGLRRAWGLKEFGVLITDSHTQPLRKGVTGIGLSHYGFKATRNLVGQEDLFGREAKMTHVNVLDSLAVAAVYQMGEIAERCPLAVIYGSGAEFVDGGAASEIEISPEEDLYGHLLFPKRG